jgi:hypothetical protein
VQHPPPLSSAMGSDIEREFKGRNGVPAPATTIEAGAHAAPDHIRATARAKASSVQVVMVRPAPRPDFHEAAELPSVDSREAGATGADEALSASGAGHACSLLISRSRAGRMLSRLVAT